MKEDPARTVQRDLNLVFDIGMHQGEDTAYYLKKGFRVVAFEANPELVARARQSFREALDESRLVLVEGAVTRDSLGGGTGQSVTFYKNQTLSVWGTVDEDFAVRSKQEGCVVVPVEVPVIDLLGCLEKFGIPYYMKVDIEGMDGVCLDALSRFDVKPAYLSIESEKVSFGKLVRELQRLGSLGYSRFQAVQQFGIPGRRVPVDSREGTPVEYCFPDNASGVFGKDLPEAWLEEEEMINRYYDIFLSYRRFGDLSWIGRHGLSRNLVYSFSRLIRRPLPGWYDTHARHAAEEKGGDCRDAR